MQTLTGWPLNYNKKNPGVFQEFSRRKFSIFQENHEQKTEVTVQKIKIKKISI